MAKLTDEEIAILQKARLIQDRMEAERLEAGEEPEVPKKKIIKKTEKGQEYRSAGQSPNMSEYHTPGSRAQAAAGAAAGNRAPGAGGSRPGAAPGTTAGNRAPGANGSRPGAAPGTTAGNRAPGANGSRPGAAPGTTAGNRAPGAGGSRPGAAPGTTAGNRAPGAGGSRPGAAPGTTAGNRVPGAGGSRPGAAPGTTAGNRAQGVRGRSGAMSGSAAGNRAPGSRPAKGSGAGQPKKPVQKDQKKKIMLKNIGIILFVVFAVLVIAAVALFFLVRAQISNTNYEPATSSYVRQADVMTDKNVKNILMLGTDERTSSDTSRSDAIILVSINTKQKRIVMTSFLRDSYVTIPGYGQNRINHAYQMGGAPLVMQTIEENFKIGVDSYVKVDFYSFMDIIDALGGVEITVTDDELIYVNGYISEINHIIGAPEGDQFLDSAGTKVLNGRQALAYSRIRYIGTDFARTERQRTVLQGLFQTAKEASPIQLYRAAISCIPDITTDINDTELTWLLFKSLFYMKYDVVQSRIPMDGTWWDENANGQEVLGIDFEANISGLRNIIYEQ